MEGVPEEDLLRHQEEVEARDNPNKKPRLDGPSAAGPAGYPGAGMPGMPPGMPPMGYPGAMPYGQPGFVFRDRLPFFLVLTYSSCKTQNASLWNARYDASETWVSFLRQLDRRGTTSLTFMLRSECLLSLVVLVWVILQHLECHQLILALGEFGPWGRCGLRNLVETNFFCQQHSA